DPRDAPVPTPDRLAAGREEGVRRGRVPRDGGGVRPAGGVQRRRTGAGQRRGGRVGRRRPTGGLGEGPVVGGLPAGAGGVRDGRRRGEAGPGRPTGRAAGAGGLRPHRRGGAGGHREDGGRPPRRGRGVLGDEPLPLEGVAGPDGGEVLAGGGARQDEVAIQGRPGGRGQGARRGQPGGVDGAQLGVRAEDAQ